MDEIDTELFDAIHARLLAYNSGISAEATTSDFSEDADPDILLPDRDETEPEAEVYFCEPVFLVWYLISCYFLKITF